VNIWGRNETVAAPEPVVITGTQAIRQRVHARWRKIHLGMVAENIGEPGRPTPAAHPPPTPTARNPALPKPPRKGVGDPDKKINESDLELLKIDCARLFCWPRNDISLFSLC